MSEDYFGFCSHCGGLLKPVYFTEEEVKYNGFIQYKTGRKRKAISHLTCERCLRNQPIDDSFDGEWH